jgi:hypothetical protein
VSTEPQALVAGPNRARIVDRLAASFLILLMAVGSLVLWIGIPAFAMWGGGQVTSTAETQFLVALPLTVIGIVLFGVFLAWLNQLYLRVTGVIAEYEADEEIGQDEAKRMLRGPLEPLLIGSLVLALIAFCVWFFFIARNPPLVPL